METNNVPRPRSRRIFRCSVARPTGRATEQRKIRRTAIAGWPVVVNPALRWDKPSGGRRALAKVLGEHNERTCDEKRPASGPIVPGGTSRRPAGGHHRGDRGLGGGLRSPDPGARHADRRGADGPGAPLRHQRYRCLPDRRAAGAGLRAGDRRRCRGRGQEPRAAIARISPCSGFRSSAASTARRSNW